MYGDKVTSYSHDINYCMDFPTTSFARTLFQNITMISNYINKRICTSNNYITFVLPNHQSLVTQHLIR